MIPRKIFTSLAKFQGIVSVNDFRLPIWLQELLKALFCFLRSFCFARIRLNPLSCQILFHDSISMIVTRFTAFTENFVICGCQVTNFPALGTTVPARLLHGALIIIFVFMQILQFGSFGKCVWTPCSPEPGSTFARGSIGNSMRRTGSILILGRRVSPWL